MKGRNYKDPLDLKKHLVSGGINLGDKPKKVISNEQQYGYQIQEEKNIVELINKLYVVIQKDRRFFGKWKYITEKQLDCVLEQLDKMDFGLHELKHTIDFANKEGIETGDVVWPFRKRDYFHDWVNAILSDYKYIEKCIHKYTFTLDPAKPNFKFNPRFKKFGKLWKKDSPETGYVEERILDQNGDFCEIVRPEFIYKIIDENKFKVNRYLEDLMTYLEYIDSTKAWLYGRKMSLDLKKHFGTILDSLRYDIDNLHLTIKKSDLTYVDLTSCMLLGEDDEENISRGMNNIHNAIEEINDYFTTMPRSQWTQQYTIRSKDDLKILERYTDTEYFFTAFSIFEENSLYFLMQCFNINTFVYSALFFGATYFSCKTIKYFYLKIKSFFK